MRKNYRQVTLAIFGRNAIGLQVPSLILPQQIIDDDVNNEKVIYSATDALINILNKCDEIVQAAYRVSDYMPNLTNDEHAKFWKNEIIPNLLDSVTQNVHARSLIIHSFGSISQLSITIQKSTEIVEQYKGSEKSIKIVQQYIMEALQELTDHLKEAMNLDNEAIKRFENQTQQLFAIIGPRYVNFIEQKVEIEEQLSKLYGEQVNLFQQLADKQGEATRLMHMIIALGGKLPKSNSEGYMAIAKTIKNIPDKIKKRILAHSVSGVRLLKRDKLYALDAPHQHNDVIYYDAIILQRTNVNVSLPDLQEQYTNVLGSLENINKIFNEELNNKEKQIDLLLLQITNITKQIDDQDKDTGLNRNSLIDCLTSIKAFASTLRTGANIYAPLVSILKGIRMTVEMDVELLQSSNDKNDVTLALNLLSSRVKFLSSFTLDARFVLDPLNQFNMTFDYHKNNTHFNSNSAELIHTNWVFHIYLISLLTLINIVGNLEII